MFPLYLLEDESSNLSVPLAFGPNDEDVTTNNQSDTRGRTRWGDSRKWSIGNPCFASINDIAPIGFLGSSLHT